MDQVDDRQTRPGMFIVDLRLMMQKLAKTFLDDESGAVTVDWVILTAAIVALATVFSITLSQNTVALGTAAGGAVETEIQRHGW